MAVGAAAGASAASAGGAATETRTPSIAYKLAAIDCNCVPRARTVTQYRAILTKLVTRKCKETKTKLADEIVRSRNILREDGYGNYKLSRLLRLLDQSIPNSIGFRQPCLDVIVSLIVLMEK